MKKSIVVLPLLMMAFANNSSADIVHNDDVISAFSHCIGNDCVSGMAFGFDTLVLKENNLRIFFDDTSAAASFPNNDWRITINDSTNGGANKFSIDDVTGGRTPFTIEAGAPSNSLYVDDGGRLGLGTAAPSTDIHIVSGNTPTNRLAQDGSSGFTPQTWDLAGNEAGFFLRDVTHGSKLSLRVRPDAPTSSLDISASGHIGFGVGTPSSNLHLQHNGNVLIDFESKDNNATQIRLISDSANQRLVARNGDNSATKSQIVMGDDELQFSGATVSNDIIATFKRSAGHSLAYVNNTTNGAAHLWLSTDSDNRRLVGATEANSVQSQISLGNGQIQLAGASSGNLYATFSASGLAVASGSISVSGTNLNVPDYVFEKDYPLMPLAHLKNYIKENKHLPEIPSAKEIDKKGMNMTEMQLHLLKKIEELTLYTLKQQEAIDALTLKLEKQTSTNQH